MSLPEITTPPGTPPFKVADHVAELMPVYDDVPMARGHSRKRRVWTRAPRTVDVSWRLTQAQMTAVHNWFETALLVGKRTFSAQVANQGPGLRWWEAKWVSPLREQPVNGGRWEVTGRLRLIGEPSVDGPVASSLALEITVPLTATAQVVSSKALAVEFVARLTQHTTLHVEFVAALETP